MAEDAACDGGTDACLVAMRGQRMAEDVSRHFDLDLHRLEYPGEIADDGVLMDLEDVSGFPLLEEGEEPRVHVRRKRDLTGDPCFPHPSRPLLIALALVAVAELFMGEEMGHALHEVHILDAEMDQFPNPHPAFVGHKAQ